MASKRIAVIKRDICKPKICNYLCQRVCPKVRSGEECITISEKDNKPLINEEVCFGCGICVNKCPTHAISIVNLPKELEEEPIHRYGPNQFVLYGLPIPKKGLVVGLIGPNAIGKSTILKILSGELKPNLGDYKKERGWEEVIEKFKGTELQNYLKGLKERGIKVGYKPQNIDLIPKILKGRVKEILEKMDKENKLEFVVSNLNMNKLLEKNVSDLSGGELQLLAMGAVMLKDCDFYFFDEPSSYLDVKQRLIAAKAIRSLASKSAVMIVEHDLAVFDYLVDQVHIIYGKPGVFGIVSKPYGVRVGINTYLDGYIKEENIRFRAEEIKFEVRAGVSEKKETLFEFPCFEKRFERFYLKTERGKIKKSEIIGILGPNAIGKTTFVKILAGELKPDNKEKINSLKISYKPQRLVLPKEEDLTVEEVLGKNKMDKIVNSFNLNKIFERKIKNLSGGELQKLFITLSLLKECDLLILDEPSAFLDVEERLFLAKLLKKFVEEKEIAAFVVDHDLQFIDAISDRIMVFEGEPGVKGFANTPCSLHDGMNKFLKALKITFRRDPETGRPRANKLNSIKDREQKERGEYYYIG